MKLADRCRTYFEMNDIMRGTKYFEQRFVEIYNLTGDSVQATSIGSGGMEYLIDIDWRKADVGRLGVSCTCARFDDGYLCKHLWATILEVDESELGAILPGSGKLQVGSHEWNDEADDYEHPDQVEGTPKARALKNKSTTQTSWIETLDFVRRKQLTSHSRSHRQPDIIPTRSRRILYVLDIPLSITNKGLIITLQQQERKKNGDLGKPKSFRIDSEKTKASLDPADRALLELFDANGHWSIRNIEGQRRYDYHDYSPSYTTIRIPKANQDLLLPQLAATGRFICQIDPSIPLEESLPIKWDSSTPWRFTLAITANDENRRWTVRGRFLRDGATRDFSDSLFSLDNFLFFKTGELCPFETTNAIPWLQALHLQTEITIPYKERTPFLRKLFSSPGLPHVELPENLNVEMVKTRPKPKLKVHTPKYRLSSSQALLADVTFLYGHDDQYEAERTDDRRSFYSEQITGQDEGVTTKGSPTDTVVPTTDQVFLRDHETEREFLSHLIEFPFRKASREHLENCELEFSQKHLASIVDKLAAKGWKIEAEGKLFRSANAFRMEITSGIDWFELDAAFDFDGVEAKLPDILAAVRKGSKYVELGDGTRGILPEQWLARYADLANLGDSEEGKVRFKPSQALIIDALITEQASNQDQMRVDRKFSRFRERLRSLDGVKAKNPPRTFQGKLRNYQCEGLGWFHFLRELGLGGCLADDMGLGKTIQTLALLEHRRTRRLGKEEVRTPSLVVVPKSLVFNWIDEASRFTPKIRALNYTGVGRKQHIPDFGDYHIIVTTYGTLRLDIANLRDQAFDYAILDEAQAIKNSKSQAAKASLLLNAKHRLALTGTPIENHLGELWSLFEFLNPGMLGLSSSFTSLCKNASRDNLESLTDLAKAVAPFILRRVKGQVLKELPEKTEQTIYCELSPKERKAYNEIRDYYREKLSKTIKEKSFKQSKIQILEALLRLRQASCHLGLVDKKRASEPSAKISTLLEQVREVIGEGHKVLVFSQFTSLLAIVRSFLDKDGIHYEYLDGSTRNRKERVENFQNDPNCPLFLISLKAGGHGLNLTAADYVFILDPWWNPAVEAQAIDRTHRIGQTRPVFAYRIIATDTVEEKVLMLQEGKRKLADAIITANDSLIRKLTADDLKLMLS